MSVQFRLVYRHFNRHPWQLLLNILGIALGVAIVLAIDLTNVSAEKAFQLASRSMTGDITHQLTNDDESIDEDWYRQIRKDLGIRKAIPFVQGQIKIDDNQSWQIMGIDPVSLLGRNVRPVLGQFKLETSPLELMSTVNAVYVSTDIQSQRQFDVPGLISIEINGRQETLHVIGILPETQDMQSQAVKKTIVADIATAQSLLGMIGKLSRIDLVLDEAEELRLAKLIDSPMRLEPSNTKGNAMEQMTRAFRINLTALSLLALVIGTFLIYNTMTISVLQRREQFATMRTLGLSRRELLSQILGEALLLSVAGIILGIILGTGLSQYLITLASRTINDLYFVNEIQDVYFSGWSFIKASLLGFVATLVASWIPARDAVSVPPHISRSRSRLEQNTRNQHGLFLICAVAFFLIAIIILWQSNTSIVMGFAALFFIIMAFACLSPPLFVFLVTIFQPILTAFMGLLGSIASRAVLSSLSRTQVAVTALAITLSATIGVSLMISSFRLSVEVWLESLLKADVFISSIERGNAVAISPEIIQQIENYPGVEKVIRTQWKRIWHQGLPIRLNITGMDEDVFNNYRFMDGDNPQRWREFSTGGSVLVSEPYAYHHRLQREDEIKLPTNKGEQLFRVAGIFTDYGSDQGLVVMHRDLYQIWWEAQQVSSLSVYLQEQVDNRSFLKGLDETVLQRTDLRARANGELRQMSMNIFDRTFAITEVLRVLTVIIASIGIFGALMAIQLERSREFAILRANGLTPMELKKLILTESGLMGAVAGIISVPTGIVMALVLIFVINRRSFGWSMDFVLQPQYLLTAVLLGLIAGLVAGIYPAWRMAATSPALALRDV